MAEVILRQDETLDKALKRYKKAVDKENINQEWRRREFFEKPSTIKHKQNRELKRKFSKKRNRTKINKIDG